MSLLAKFLVGIAIWIALVIAVAVIFDGGRGPQPRRKQNHPEN